ncbi:hypothetical protein Asp14428_19810 [Actinoplanes sp. NBRC 14428]|nr:hypothetical protein Asp14428_19810 [Actinoplanes sp. NBRC 14428]
MRKLTLVVNDTETAVDFYTAVLGGRETMRDCLLDGHIIYAEIEVGDYRLCVEERTEIPTVRTPAAANPLPCPDPERLAARCAAAGALIEPGPPPVVRDRDGYRWALRTAAVSTTAG